MIKKLALAFLIILVGAATGLFLWTRVSPLPMAMGIRFLFDQGAKQASEALEKHLPDNIHATLNIPYDPADPKALLDIYYPKDLQEGQKLPLIVWIHGGAFISGHKEDIRNYLKILASHGFVVAAPEYTYAPEAQYPTPIRQTLQALEFLTTTGLPYPLDPEALFLAGDSAGAQIVGQVANIITSPEYALAIQLTSSIPQDKIKGLLLHCGAFDASLVNFDRGFGFFLRTVFWSYFGSKDFRQDPRLKEFSVIENMTARFPPFFISAGNADKP